MCPISYILDIHSLHVSSCLAATCRLVLCDLLSSKSCHTNTILLSYTRTIDFSPLIQSDLGMQSLSKSPSEWKFPVIASSFLVLKSISLISFIVQSTIPTDVIKQVLQMYYALLLYWKMKVLSSISFLFGDNIPL